MLQTILRAGSRMLISELRVVIFTVLVGGLPILIGGQTPLTNGSNHPGTMVANGTVEYSFTGAAGQGVELRVGATNFVPKIQLFASNGTLLGTAPTTAPNGSVRDVGLTNAFPAADTYRVVVSSYYANNAGPYSLRFVAAPGPYTTSAGDEGGSLQSGDRVTGQIELGDLDVWTFTGNPGDSIQVRMGGTNLVPKIDLFGPDGKLIKSEPSTAPSGNVRDTVLAAQLSASGTYTIVASSYYANSGGYGLSLARAPGDFTVPAGDEGGTMASGAFYSASLDLGDLDMWKLTANAGDSLQVRMGAPNLVPRLDIYGPDGALLYTSPANPPSGNLRDTVQPFTAATTGTYIVVASSYYSGGAGNYSINISHAPSDVTVTPGDQGGTLTNAFQQSASLTLGDLDVWSFNANAGNSIQLRMSGDTFPPRIDLYGPDGKLVATAPATAPSGNLRDASMFASAATSGTYIVVASGYYAGSAGDYRLSLVRVPDEIHTAPGDEGGALTNGWLNVATIDLGDLDVWTFQGKAGDRLELRMGATNVVPRIDLYGPDGALIDTEPSTPPSGNLRDVLLTNRLSVDGEFTVVTSGYYSGNVGGYGLTLVKAPGALLAAPGDEGGILTNGIPYSGTNSLGDIDAWTFYGTPGDSNVFRIMTTSYAPYLRVYGPNGDLVKEGAPAGSGSRTNQMSYVVTTAGTYTFLTEGTFSGSAGVYGLKQSRVPPDINMPAQIAIDEGTTLNLTITAQDPDVPNKTLTFALQGAPPGVTLTSQGPTNAALVWATTEADGPSTNTFLVTVTDIVNVSSFTRTNTFTVVVNEVNVAPVLTLPADTQVNELTPLNVSASATDVDIPKNGRSFSLVAPPEGMTIDPSSGAISWIPTEAQGPGSYPVNVVVTDDNPTAINAQHLSTTNTFNVTVGEVNTAPQVTITDQVVDEGKLLTATVAATDSDLPPNSKTFALVNPPQGLTIDSASGVLSWTPTEAQGPSTNAITVTVTDDNPAAVNERHLSTSKTFNIVVNEVNTAPTFGAITQQTIDELKTLTVSNKAIDTDVPANTVTYALVGAPAGVTIATDGVITWTPTEAQGPTNVTITTIATDNGVPPLSATNTFTVVVNEVNTPPVIADIPEQSGRVGLPITIQSQVTDNDLPANHITLSLENAPTGMTVDSGTGTISWTPSDAQVGAFSVVLKATDDGTPVQSASKTFQVTVTSPDARLVATGLSNSRIQLDITGNQAHTYNLERSSNLKDWETVLQVPLVNGKYVHIEAMNVASRFYRLKQIQ